MNNTTDDNTLTSSDGYGTFAIGYPHQGQVCLAIFFSIFNLYLKSNKMLSLIMSYI